MSSRFLTQVFHELHCTCFYKMQVHANFFVPKLSLALFKCVCGECHLFYILRQGDMLCFCNGCKIDNTCFLDQNLNGYTCAFNDFPIDAKL